MKERDLFISFVVESNRIEGINRPATDEEVDALISFVNAPAIEIGDLCALVSCFQPGAVLRDRVGLNVRVGSHIPPFGGPHIREALKTMLKDIGGNTQTPFKAHCQYETLHPFTDGNGRSGRALWLRTMFRLGLAWRIGALGFLHIFYYQSLEESR